MHNSDIESRVARGIELFKQGYNCSQSVTMAFADVYDVPQDLMARISASFGGGIGRMRETCGTASAMFMLAGLQIATPYADKEVKARNYAAVQELAARFKAETGSLICRELLTSYVKKLQQDANNINGNIAVNPATITYDHINTNPTPEERTDDYYRKRPCVKMVELAIRIYAQWLEEKSF